MTTAGKTPELSPGLDTFLESVGRGFLVTRRQDGSPTTHPLTPLWADGAIHFNTYRKSAKVRNLLRHPRVACAVTSADDDLSYFAPECRGSAEVLDLPDIPDSILGVDDKGQVMDASDLDRGRKNVASGNASICAWSPRSGRCVNPWRRTSPPRRISWHPTRMPRRRVGPLAYRHDRRRSHGIPAPEAGRRSRHGGRRRNPQGTTGPLHRRARRPASDCAPPFAVLGGPGGGSTCRSHHRGVSSGTRTSAGRWPMVPPVSLSIRRQRTERGSGPKSGCVSTDS